MKLPIYYLSSLDSYVLETVRECRILAFKRFDTGKVCALAELNPAIPGQTFGVNGDISQIVLANRHEGEGLSNITSFPCFVHVARLCATTVGAQETLITGDVENLAWGELYRSRSDAENHVFD